MRPWASSKKGEGVGDSRHLSFAIKLWSGQRPAKPGAFDAGVHAVLDGGHPQRHLAPAMHAVDFVKLLRQAAVQLGITVAPYMARHGVASCAATDAALAKFAAPPLHDRTHLYLEQRPPLPLSEFHATAIGPLDGVRARLSVERSPTPRRAHAPCRHARSPRARSRERSIDVSQL